MKIFKKKNDLNTYQELLDKIGNMIYSGPFSGLMIPIEVKNKLSLSEFLGMYESCLHPCFESLINKEINNIIFVGGNNGYYSAGLTYVFNPNSIQIFESDLKFHNIIESWFVLNNFKNYQINGIAGIEQFNKINRKIDLLFMDCEGFEAELLNPSLFMWQKDSDILVELHPFYIKNILSIITDRFRDTHYIEIIHDDFNEDIKIETILRGFNLKLNYNKNPNHRWIIKDNKKIFTSGIFLYLKKK